MLQRNLQLQSVGYVIYSNHGILFLTQTVMKMRPRSKVSEVWQLALREGAVEEVW